MQLNPSTKNQALHQLILNHKYFLVILKYCTILQNISNYFLYSLENVETAKIWLSQNGLSANFEDIKSNWIITYQVRKSEIQGLDNKSITERHLSDIFKAWPILCSSRGPDLVSFPLPKFHFI